MKQLKKFTAIALAVMTLSALFGAPGASATILEVNGVTQSGPVTITASLLVGSSLVTQDTSTSSWKTCTSSHMHGSTDGVDHENGTYTAGVYAGHMVVGALAEGSSGLSFANCDKSGNVTHTGGRLAIEHIAGTTNGTVFSLGAEITTGSEFGTLNCKTGTGTHLGTLTGTASGHATIHINTVIPCSGKSLLWKGTYTITSPTGLGVSKEAISTTLEVGGTPKVEALEIATSLKSGTSAVLKDTFGFSSNTCTVSEAEGDTDSPFTGATVTAALDTLSFSTCDRTVTVHKAGTLHVQHLVGTTNGTVTSSGAEVTTGSPFGTLNCKTGTGTHLGTLTGVKSGHATLHVKANLSCSGVSSVWEATYIVTGPTGLGVTV